MLVAVVFLAGIAVLVGGARPASGQYAEVEVPVAFDVAELGLPNGERPVVVRAGFHLHDINAIDDDTETFELNGVLTLDWRDSRLAFDPGDSGADERIYQGDFQFSELAAAWFPQVVLVNQSGLFEEAGVVQRIRADGSATLMRFINASAEVDLDMRQFPFDEQRLIAEFEVFGFDRGEVVFEAAGPVTSDPLRVPQWEVLGRELSVVEDPAPYAGRGGGSSRLVLSVDVARRSWYARRLVVLPLVVIVLLAFSVFWMEESSSLSDRLSVSFIGILTGVTYQVVITDQLPHISYFTVMHAFLGWSFFVMCATVLPSVIVVGRRRRGENESAAALDRLCRWAFPLVYVSVNLVLFASRFVLR